MIPLRLPETFFDDTRGNTFEADIRKLVTIGLTTGKTRRNGSKFYDPDGKLTRGQLAAFTFRALKKLGVSFPSAPRKAAYFKDIGDNVFFGDVERLYPQLN